MNRFKREKVAGGRNRVKLSWAALVLAAFCLSSVSNPAQAFVVVPFTYAYAYENTDCMGPAHKVPAFMIFTESGR